MRFHAACLCVALLISTISASPLPQNTPPVDTQYDSIPHYQDSINPRPSSSIGSTLAGLALAGTGTAFLIGGGIGISEWALNWYTRFLRGKSLRDHQNQTLQENQSRRQEQRNRRERAMDLILEMAENYSKKVSSEKDFDGHFEPLIVPHSIVGAVENVFEQTADVERVEVERDRGNMESLEGLKKALKPILEFKTEDVNKRVDDLVDLTKWYRVARRVSEEGSDYNGPHGGSHTSRHRFC